MFETTVKLKPREEWRPGMTPDKLKAELDALVKLPGVSNVWAYPIKTRIDMLATGIRTPVGIKIMGPDLATIQHLGQQIEDIVRQVPGTTSVYAERTATGRYVDIDIDRVAAGRYGLNIDDVQAIVGSAVGGMTVSYTVEGLERYPINLRYPQGYRDSLEKLRQLPIVAPTGANITLQDVARVDVADGPSMIRSENARPSGWVFVDLQGRDLGGFVREAKAGIARQLDLPAGYSLSWSGQYEYLERAVERLKVVVPLTLSIIVLLLYLNFRNGRDVMMILFTLPFALVGGIWFMWLLDYELSIAAAVGFIALAGVAAETGVVMLMYLEHAWADRRERAASEGRQPDTRGTARVNRGGRVVAPAAKAHDRDHHHRRPAADHVGLGYRRRSHAPDRGTDGGRHGLGDHPDPGHHSVAVPAREWLEIASNGELARNSRAFHSKSGTFRTFRRRTAHGFFRATNQSGDDHAAYLRVPHARR